MVYLKAVFWVLFVIYIINMPDAVNYVIKMFADDSKLIATIRKSADLEVLQGDLDTLSGWFYGMAHDVQCWQEVQGYEVQQVRQ